MEVTESDKHSSLLQKFYSIDNLKFLFLKLPLISMFQFCLIFDLARVFFQSLKTLELRANVDNILRTF
jgi:hypothetical protein